MEQLFNDVFNPQNIYETLFFNVKSVLIHPTLTGLEKDNKLMYKHWIRLSKDKYGVKPDDDIESQQSVFEKNAPYYPEFSKIVAITYATVYMDNGKVKRYMKKIVNDDEFIILLTFIDELSQLSSEGVQSTPKFFPILCGHNIINYDIPLLLKKFIYYHDRFETNNKIPLILKKSLSIKPWESGIIDTINVWKFNSYNGYNDMSLMLISDYLGLKRTVDLLPLNELSEKYWKLYKKDNEKALEFVSLQSATQTNLVIQLMNTLRIL